MVFKPTPTLQQMEDKIGHLKRNLVDLSIKIVIQRFASPAKPLCLVDLVVTFTIVIVYIHLYIVAYVHYQWRYSESRKEDLAQIIEVFRLFKKIFPKFLKKNPAVIKFIFIIASRVFQKCTTLGMGRTYERDQENYKHLIVQLHASNYVCQLHTTHLVCTMCIRLSSDLYACNTIIASTSAHMTYA